MIREATLTDAKTLAEIGQRTFVDTYAHLNTPENIVKYLEGKFTEEQLIAELSEPETVFFVDENTDSELISYAKIRVNLAEMPDPKAIEIERIYVSKDAQSQGLGKAMLQACCQKAKALSYETIWLGVWEKNTKALGFYKKMGFEIFGKHNFQLGDDAQTDLLMKKHLVE